MRQRTRGKDMFRPGGSWKQTSKFATDYSAMPPYPVRRLRTVDYVDKENRTLGNEKLDKYLGIVPGRPPTDFDTDRTTWRMNGVSGFWQRTSSTRMEWNDWIPSLYRTSPAHLQPSKALETDLVYVNRLLAGTNPFRSTQSVPVFAVELLELATLFKVVFRNAASVYGSSYLNVKFGWKALIDDLRAFADLTTAIESRMKEFDSFFQPGGVRRKLYLGSDSTSHTYAIGGVVNHFTSPAQAHFVTKRTIWGSCHWTPTWHTLTKLDEEALKSFNYSVRQVLDLEYPDPETVWQMIPFSWLVDYFVDFSAAFGAREAEFLAVPRDICLMRSTETSVRVTRAGVWHPNSVPPYVPVVRWDGGTIERTTKYRKVFPDGVPSGIPVSIHMNGSQVNTVLALISHIVGLKSRRTFDLSTFRWR